MYVNVELIIVLNVRKDRFTFLSVYINYLGLFYFAKFLCKYRLVDTSKGETMSSMYNGMMKEKMAMGKMAMSRMARS